MTKNISDFPTRVQFWCLRIDVIQIRTYSILKKFRIRQRSQHTTVQYKVLNLKSILNPKRANAIDWHAIPAVMDCLVRRHTHTAAKFWRSICTPGDSSVVPKVGGRVAAGARNKEARARESQFAKLGVSLGGLPSLSGQRSVIDSIGPTSFTVSGVRVSGSLLVLPTFSTLWNVNSLDDISPVAFTLIKLCNPRPDLVLIGTGLVMKVSFKLLKNERKLVFVRIKVKTKISDIPSQPISHDTRRFLAELGIGVEVSSTKNACQTFNVLNQEFRNVAAAIVPNQFNIE